MPFWNRKQNWEDEYDHDYARDRRSGQPRGAGRFWFVPHLLTLMFVGALFVGGCGMIAGKTMVEKLLTSLVTPTGIVWLTLILMIYFSLLTRQSWAAMIGLFCWLVLTVGGNELVSNQLVYNLEKPYESIDVLELEPFETVVLLGGGTNTARNGRPQFDLGGDRVGLGAALYHAGKIERFICTGTQKYRSTEKDLHPREETAELLRKLNVPESAILQMKGENTFQEMQNLKTFLSDNELSGRVGLLTSASHMSRAIRLADSNGLTVEPIPANFISEFYSPQPSVIVPSSENLLVTTRAIKEYLAGFVGR